MSGYRVASSLRQWRWNRVIGSTGGSNISRIARLSVVVRSLWSSSGYARSCDAPPASVLSRWQRSLEFALRARAGRNQAASNKSVCHGGPESSATNWPGRVSNDLKAISRREALESLLCACAFLDGQRAEVQHSTLAALRRGPASSEGWYSFVHGA
jgi:hypothetical protein